MGVTDHRVDRNKVADVRAFISERQSTGAHLVKICGLREVEHAVAAAAAGADLLGFIFAPARRQVTPELARAAIAAARAIRPEVLAVGAFVDAPASEINEVAACTGLDLVQLSGSESPDFLRQVNRPVIKALFPVQGTPAREVERQIAAYSAAENAPVLYLVDGHVPGLAGGTGVRADWALAGELAGNWPVLLAGGLAPENVAEAVDTVRPFGVDVSSGVETDGDKDPSRIAAFVAGARTAFAELGSATR